LEKKIAELEIKLKKEENKSSSALEDLKNTKDNKNSSYEQQLKNL